MNQIEKIEALFAKNKGVREKWSELQKLYDSKNLKAFYIWGQKQFLIENVDVSNIFSEMENSNRNGKFQVIITNSL